MNESDKYDVCFVCFEDLLTDARTVNLVRTYVKHHKRIAIIVPETGKVEAVAGSDCFFLPSHEHSRFYRNWLCFNRNIRQYKDVVAKIYWANDFYSLDATRYLQRRNGGNLYYDSREIYSALGTLAGHPIKQLLLSMKEKSLVRYVDLITVSGQMDADYLRDYFKFPVKYSVIMNLPPKSKIPKSDKLHRLFDIPDDKKILIYQGVVLKGRGIVTTIRALQFLDDCVFVVIGDGAFRSDAEGIAKALHLEDRVFFTGKVPYSDLPYYTAGADIGTAFIEPVSFSYRLALPNKLFEYFMAGLPVIVSDIPALRKIFGEENCPPGELLDSSAGPKEFAQAIRKICENENVYREVAMKLADRYSYETQEQTILDLIQDNYA